MYSKYYNIADIIIQINAPFEIYINNAEDFICDQKEPDYIFNFEETNNIPKIIGNSQFIQRYFWCDNFLREDGTYLRAFLYQDQFYSEVTILNDHTGTCYYVSDQIIIDRANIGFELMNYLCIEQILLKFNSIVLHSSHCNVNGKALLFSAPSQTGKSTQANLWNEYEQVRVLNGDRSVLRKKDGIWHAYGCPMCGTSGIHKQGNEPLADLVMLGQSPTNHVERLKPMKAFKLIYPQITTPTWDHKMSNQVISLIEDLIANVPVWYYVCNMKKEAVTVLNDTLHLL